jgi:hypothetical protein
MDNIKNTIILILCHSFYFIDLLVTWIITKWFGNTVQCDLVYICLHSAYTCFGQLWPSSEGNNNMLRNYCYIDRNI